MSRISIRVAGLTDQGKVRPNNEDAVWADAETGLLVVADGMGGHSAGEVASGMAIATIPVTLKQLNETGHGLESGDTRFSDGARRLGFCLETANRRIFEASTRSPEDSGMGTTCTAALIDGDRLSLAHVGDTRCYLIRRGTIEQLTQDHSLAMDQVRRGLISREEAVHVNQNILTRSLGTQPEVQVDLDEHPLFPGDVLLLCSDGLNKELTDEQVLEAVTETPDPQVLAQRLVDMANDSGGQDNITVAVARIEEAGLGESILKFFKSKK